MDNPQQMRNEVIFDEPQRGEPPVLCSRPGCHDEIEAYGERRYSLSIQGIREYLWRHVSTGEITCQPQPPPSAKPYDGWQATANIERGQLAHD